MEVTVNAAVEAVKRVKRGIRLLERKVPNWRTVLRKHEADFDFANGEHCVLGTLEHFSGRMRQLKDRTAQDSFANNFERAYRRLGIKEPEDFGFDSAPAEGIGTELLSELWRAEFAKDA